MLSMLKRLTTFTSGNSFKSLNMSSVTKLNKNQVKEIQIPVPWGHIAGKWWGRTDVQPILAVHGVQDNAATFDNLVPLLNTEAVLALDLPGHGWSSHLPIGTPYNYMHGVSLLRYIINSYYQWKQPILLGHSLGSSFIFTYASVFPDEIDTYISIDCSRHQSSFHIEKYLTQLSETVDKSLKYEQTKNPPEYTYAELLDLFYVGRQKLITKELCEILLSRGVKKLPNAKVKYSRDVRVKLKAFDYMTVESMLQLAPKIKCKVLTIQANDGVIKNDYKGDVFQKTVDLISKNSIKSEQVILKGTHHLHLDHAEEVAQVINTFLSSALTSKRSSL